MTVYTGPGFEMAVKQFELIANYLGIPDDVRPRLLMPEAICHGVVPNSP